MPKTDLVIRVAGEAGEGVSAPGSCSLRPPRAPASAS